ncbi:hypothetical protein C8J57DRAFT_1619817 [Mycena rebaudengoi]|nr:hypothetical protein C8J57DRAFT_1619817 [Mycena rebaudengoi]
MRLIVIDLKTRDSTQLLEMGSRVELNAPKTFWATLSLVVLKRELLDHSLPIHIAARHIFLLVHSTSQVQHLRIFAISVQELAGLWQHISSISLQDAIEVGDVPATVADELPFSDPLCLKWPSTNPHFHADGYKLTVHYVDLPALAVTLPAGSAKRYLRHSEGKVRTSAWELTSGVQGFRFRFATKYPMLEAGSESSDQFAITQLNTAFIFHPDSFMASPTVQPTASPSNFPSRTDNTITEILPNLFLGSQLGALNVDLLRSKNITHILSVMVDPQPEVVENGFRRMVIPVIDWPDQELLIHFKAANAFIDDGKDQR